MKKLADFGLEKIPTEALLSMARQEIGELESYITELEDKLDATEKELKSLKAFLESDVFSLTVAEQKKLHKELREQEYIQSLIADRNRWMKSSKGQIKEYQEGINKQLSRISKLEARLKENGIAIPEGL